MAASKKVNNTSKNARGCTVRFFIFSREILAEALGMSKQYDLE